MRHRLFDLSENKHRTVHIDEVGGCCVRLLGKLRCIGMEDEAEELRAKTQD